MLKRYHLTLNEKKTKVVDLTKTNHVKIAGINIVNQENTPRKITVGRKIVRELYFRAVALHSSVNPPNDLDIQQIKGMQSFILSIEKNGYSYRLAKGMRLHIQHLGFETLEDLVSNLGQKNNLEKQEKS